MPWSDAHTVARGNDAPSTFPLCLRTGSLETCALRPNLGRSRFPDPEKGSGGDEEAHMFTTHRRGIGTNISLGSMGSLEKQEPKDLQREERQFTPEETTTQAISNAREWQSAQLGIENKHSFLTSPC
ncbi:unnamed protein product [Microthlaspi erraticum]|uniref:Uncharacterized protein n=1 Tax=Microthlaspi erraticum TaxID=1685480 RepID=A0A6D2IM72_9BRAS|nr:unnamed protein product [Microthlaspi erraticum]